LVPPRYFAHKKGIEFNLANVKKNKEDYVIGDLNSVILNQKDKIQAQVEDALARSNGHDKIVVLTTSIEHATIVYSLLEDASIVHSQQAEKERLANFESFTNGNARFLVSVLIVSEGFDFPPATMLWFMRPTRSTTLYIQAVGRVLRPYEGKKFGVILDYGQVVFNLGDIEDAFENACKKKKKKDDVEEKERFCIHCYCYSSTDDNTCPNCGEYFKLKCNKCGAFYNKGDKCGCNAPVDRLKNLTEEAWSEMFDLVSFEIDRSYTSKNGNPCDKITYHFTGFTCYEYFPKGKWWAKNLFNKRLAVLIDEESMAPFSATLRLEGKPIFSFTPKNIEALIIRKDGFYKVSDLFAKENIGSLYIE